MKIDHLYVLMPLALLGIFVALAPLAPHDFWWHLRVGQIIADERQIPHTVLFAWTVPRDSEYIYGEWLAEWLFYGLYASGGTDAVIFSRNLLALATFAIVGMEAQRRTGSWRLAGLGVAVAGALTLNNLNVRPQNWSWLLAALYLLILGRYATSQLEARWLVALPLLMATWANLHGGFILGILMVGATAVGESVRWWLRQQGALRPRQLFWLWGIAAATPAATLVNPQGPGIVAYVHDHVLHEASRRFGVEWQPPTPEGFNMLFFASVLLLLAALAYARRRPSPTDLLLTCGLLWLAWSSQRYVTWYGMVAMPILAQCLADPDRSRISRPPAANILLLNWLIAAALLVPLALVQPWLIRSIPLPAEYRALTYGPPAPPLISTATPLGATDFLRTHPGGNLFNEMGYGSYLIWALPEPSVFIDPRMQPYPLSQFEDYLRISRGEGAAELLARYGANRVMLSVKEQGKLSRALAEAPGWEREYADQWSEIWRFSAARGSAG